jgi:hypothetical protein
MTLFYNAGFDVVNDGTFEMTFVRGGEANFTVDGSDLKTAADALGNNVSLMAHGAGNFKFSFATLPNGTQPLADTWADESFGEILEDAIIAQSDWASEVFSVQWNTAQDVPVVGKAPGYYTVSETSAFDVTFTNNFTRNLLGVGNGVDWDTTDNSYSSTQRPTYTIIADLDELSKVSDEYEPGGQASLAVSDGYGITGISRTVKLIYFDFTQEFEARAKVFERKALTAEPWTWWHLFTHCSQGYPFALVGSHFDTDYPIVFLRDEGTAFEPKIWHPDNDERWHIPFKCVLAGYV